MRYVRHNIARAVIGISCLFAASCIPNGASASTGAVLSANELRMQVGGLCYVGDASYAVVRKEWLSEFYAKYRDRLFKQGITRWDSSFDCNHFSYNFVAQAQTDYFATSFHDRNRANTLAVGLIWYITRKGQSHSVVMAVTESGLIYMDPQTGQFLELTPAEKRSATLQLF